MKKSLIIALTCIFGYEMAIASDEVGDKNYSGVKPSKMFNSKTVAREPGGGCFDESTHIISLGVGLPGPGNSYYRFSKGNGYSSGSTPLFSLSYEQAIKQRVGPGYIGAGAYLGYRNVYNKYDYDYFYNNHKGKYYYRNNWNTVTIAARAAYHWDVLNKEKGEVYGGSMIGLHIRSYSYTSNDPDPDHYDNGRVSEGSVYPAFSVFAGARWYFANNVAVFGEVGTGISFLTGGLSFKF